MLKTIVTTAVLFIFLTVWNQYKYENRTIKNVVHQDLTVQDKERSAAKANIDLNRGLPTMLDAQTMLTRVEADTVSTTYHIKMVNYPSAYLDQDFVIKAQETIGRRLCASQDAKWSYDQGMHMKYIVSGSDNKQVGSFIISKHYCQRFR